MNQQIVRIEELEDILLQLQNFAPIPQTGQNKCWDSSLLGIPINCEGTGQDGEMQKGVAWLDPKFTDNIDDTVTDALPGLIWLKNAKCFGPVALGYVPWQSALDACTNLQSGECVLSIGPNLGNRRLLDVRELHSKIDFNKYHPTLTSAHTFKDVITYYWTSPTVADSPDRAFRVSLEAGNRGEGTKLSPDVTVLPVRGG